MLNVLKRPPMYDEEAVQPMRDELTAVGIQELRTPEDVEKAIKVYDDKTVLVVMNSVCGCAAGGARPGVSLALQNAVIPDRLTTVFAGQDRDAVDLVRSYIPAPPSSPSMAIFKNGEPVYFMPRYEIEGYTFEQIADKLKAAFEKHCSAKGPSVSPEHYAQVQHAKMCGSKIPMYKG
ncbi:MAG: BrxA/BrxB family bacilliredoxin [Ignavibacteriaceae bacterium]|nr:BrxA/BrxB family bacilliredoxin [Ignavibacteriaceae bacterium]